LYFQVFSRITPRIEHKRLYVYATYDPPLPLTPGPLPVTFGCLSINDREQLYSAFDESVHWQSIGKGSDGFVSFGPTGPTHVVHLNRRKCDKTTNGFFVASQSYTGFVTLNFLLAPDAVGWNPRHSIRPNESKGLLLQSSAQVAPGTFVCLRHAIQITDGKWTVKGIRRVTLRPGGNIAVFLRNFVNALSPDLSRRRRLLLPMTFPYSLSVAAKFAGLPPPHRIGLIGSSLPIEHNDLKDYASLSLLAFDPAGRFVGVHDRQSPALFSWGQSFSGAVKTERRTQYTVTPSGFGPPEWPYYSDAQAFTVDLDGLIAQGIWSLAIAVIPPRGYKLAKARRKAIRIVDADRKIEIGLSHVAVPWVGTKWGILAGGLVYVDDGWSWLPGGDLVANANIPQYQACWHQRLLKEQLVLPD
jgi:hypothetical protein